MTTMLARYESYWRTHQETEARREQELAAQRERRARAEAEAEHQRQVALVRKYLPDDVFEDWQVSPKSEQHGSYYLIPRFLTEHVPCLSFEERRNGDAVPRLRVSWGSYSVSIDPGRTSPEVEYALATVLMPACQEMAEQAREQEQQEREQREREARWAQAQARLATVAERVRAELEQHVQQRTEGLRWPDGRTLAVYRLEWVDGVDADGTSYRQTAWALGEEPGDWWRVIARDGVCQQQVRTPNALLVTTETWRGIEDVPRELVQTIECSRDVSVQVQPGEGPSEWVRVSATIPAPGLRQALGLDARDIERYEQLPPLVVSIDGEELPAAAEADGADPLPF